MTTVEKKTEQEAREAPPSYRTSRPKSAPRAAALRARSVPRSSQAGFELAARP